MHVVILNVVVINFQRSDGVFERPSASSFELENTTYRQWKNIHKCIIYKAKFAVGHCDMT